MKQMKGMLNAVENVKTLKPYHGRWIHMLFGVQSQYSTCTT